MSPANYEEDKVDVSALDAINTDESIGKTKGDEATRGVLLLIEPRPLVQWCLTRWLHEDFDGFQVLPLASPGDASSRSGEDRSVDLVLWSIGGLDISQPGAAEALERVKLAFADAPIVLLADRDDPADIADAMRHGARGYIPTSFARREIAEILRFVRLGGTFVPASVLLERPAPQPSDPAAADTASPFGDLTPRELQVVDLLRQAKSNKVIAYDLDLSESTVKVIVHRILNKLNAANRTEVACLALRYLQG